MRNTIHSQRKAFEERKINDIDTLLQTLSSSGFITLDAEPWGAGDPKSYHISQIGLGYVPPFTPQQTELAQPPTLQAYIDRHRINSRCFQVAGKYAGVTRRETFDYSNVQAVPDDDEELETILLATLDSWHVPEDAIIASFGMNFEKEVLIRRFPRLARRCYTDVQDLAEAISDRRAPSMRETLIALGFQDDRKAVLGSVKRVHCAGNDVVRIAVVLLCLLSRTFSDSVLHIEQTPRRHRWRPGRNMSKGLAPKKLWFGRRPMPRELYPYAARVTLQRDGGPVQGKGFMTPEELLVRFKDWHPKAVGVSGSVGWVCLSTLAELEDFVGRVHGQKQGQTDAIWKVESMFDPEVVPAKDVRAFREAQVVAQKACRGEKRADRLQRREQGEGEDDVVDLFECLGLD